MSPNTRFYKPGQTLFNEGDPSRSLFIVTKGVVSIRKKKGGKHIEIGKVTVNEVIGELSFFDRVPERSAWAIAIVDVEVLEITFEALDKVYETIPDYFKTIIGTMATRLRKANEQIKQLERERLSN